MAKILVRREFKSSSKFKRSLLQTGKEGSQSSFTNSDIQQDKHSTYGRHEWHESERAYKSELMLPMRGTLVGRTSSSCLWEHCCNSGVEEGGEEGLASSLGESESVSKADGPRQRLGGGVPADVRLALSLEAESRQLCSGDWAVVFLHMGVTTK